MSDLRHAFRRLAKSPGFTAIALVTLALGIGLNTSMFSLMNLLILKPLPFHDRDRLVRIYRTTPQSQTANHSAADFLDLAPETASFADLAAYRMWGYTLAPEGRPSVNLNALRVSAGFFPALGLKPEVGRFFTKDEDRPGNHVMILSYATWQAQFGGNPSIVGQTVKVDGESTTIVGVMPSSFSSVFLWGPGDVFRPLGLTDLEKKDRTDAAVSLLARIHPGMTIGQFNTRLSILAERLSRLRPKDRSKDGLHAVSLQSTTRSQSTIGISWLLVGLAGIVLLIACANLANLQMARAIARSHEFAIRAALGASRARLLRPLLGESLLLAIGGGLLGVLVANWANAWISSRLSSNGFVTFTLTMDWKVLIFAVLLSAATGLFFGIVPAWLMTRVRVNDALKSGTRGNTGDRAQHRVRHSLIVGQFALALILLAGAGFFLRSMDRLLAVDPGWAHQSMVQAVLNLPQARYATPGQTYAFYTRLQERLEALPGVESATVGWTLPVFQFLTSRNFVVEGREPPPAGHEPLAYVNAIMPNYLDTLKVRLRSGRNFTDADTLTAPSVVIISGSMARALFPNENPIGRRIGAPDPNHRRWAEIVGVVPDLGMAAGVVPTTTKFLVLLPLAQETWNYVTVAVRTGGAAAQIEPMRQAIAALDPTLAVQQLGTVDHAVKLATNGFAMVNTIMISFACLGLFLASMGLYGVIARLVVQRTPEIGVRVALGAQSRDVLWLIMRSGIKLTLWGTTFGVLGAFGLRSILAHLQPGAPANDPLAILIVPAVSLVLLGIGLVACWLPARRAMKVDPMVALRAE